jgi:hypothetical protein
VGTGWLADVARPLNLDFLTFHKVAADAVVAVVVVDAMAESGAVLLGLSWLVLCRCMTGHALLYVVLLRLA